MNRRFTDNMNALKSERSFTHSYIAPIEFLDCVPDNYRSCHLILAHLLGSEKYCEFYRRKHAAGDVIILDNGAFEFGAPMPVLDYSVAMKNVLGFDVDMVVAPDYPKLDYRETIRSTDEFLRDFPKYFNPDKTKVMAVPQSLKGDYEGWLSCYEHFVTDKRISAIGMSILGIPNAFCELTGTLDISANRRAAVGILMSSGMLSKSSDIWHHFLGCGDPREVVDMMLMGLADSNDSSSAIWHGILGVEYDGSSSGLVRGKSKIPVDFYINDDGMSRETILNNVMYLENLIDRFVRY